MNFVSIIGRITKDPELKYTKAEKAYTRFCVAVDGLKDKDGNRKADFIDCIAWNKAAELITNYFSKGSRIGVSGRLHTTSYETDDGEKRKYTEVMVNEIDFLDPKKESSGAGEVEPDPEEERPTSPTPKKENIAPVDPDLDLPFEI